MMKKLFCMLLAALALLCVSAAMAEEAGMSLRIDSWWVEPVGEAQARLHLLLRKDGGGCYELEDVTVQLLDAQGQEIPTVSAETTLFPLHQIPTGTHFLPVTVLYTLEAPAEVADISVTGATGRAVETTGAVELAWNLPSIAVQTGDEVVFTAWMPLEEGTDPEDYFAVLLALDESYRFVSGVELPAGSGRAVDAEGLSDGIFEATGYTKQFLLDNGFLFEYERYVFFDRVTVTGLSEKIATYSPTCYRLTGAEAAEEEAAAEEAAAQVEMLFDRLDVAEDGTFVLQGCLKNGTDVPQRFEEIAYLLLLDENGLAGFCEEYTVETPFQVMNPGEIMPYRIEGRTEAGFRAERPFMEFVVNPAETSDHRSIGGGQTTPVVGSQVSVQGVVPDAGEVEAAECFYCVLLLDIANDDYLGAVWSLAGEAWLADGDLRFPTLETGLAPEQPFAMVAMYCAAE